MSGQGASVSAAENGHPAPLRPILVFFYSATSGRCRTVEGYLAQILQHRKNHDTFRLYQVEEDSRPDLFEHFRITAVPTLVVVDNQVIRGRLQQPRTAEQIRTFLKPWLNYPGRVSALP